MSGRRRGGLAVLVALALLGLTLWVNSRPGLRFHRMRNSACEGVLDVVERRMAEDLGATWIRHVESTCDTTVGSLDPRDHAEAAIRCALEVWESSDNPWSRDDPMVVRGDAAPSCQIALRPLPERDVPTVQVTQRLPRWPFGEHSRRVTIAAATDKARLEPILEQLSALHPFDRAEAAWALTPYGSRARAAVPRLHELLGSDPADDVRQAAARALGAIVDPASIPLLEEAMASDPDGRVRGAAAGALVRFVPGHPELLAVLERALMTASDDKLLTGLRVALKDLGSPALPLLTRVAVEGQTFAAREAAIQTLGWFRDAVATDFEVRDVLDRALVDPSLRLQLVAVDAYWRITRDPEHVRPTLERIARGEAGAYRGAAMRALDKVERGLCCLYVPIAVP